MSSFRGRLLAATSISISICAWYVLCAPPALAQNSQLALTNLELHNPSQAVRDLIGARQYNRAIAVGAIAIAKYNDPAKCQNIGVLDWRTTRDGQELAFRELSNDQRRLLMLADLLNLQGTAYHGLGKYAEAEDCFRQALKANPQHAIAAANLGAILVKLKKTDEAFVALNKAIEANMRSETAYRSRATIFRRRNQFDKEREDIQSYHNWQKRNEDDGINLSFLSRFDWIGKQLEKAPRTPANLVALAMVRKEQMRQADAIKYLQDAIAQNPRMTEAYWAYGYILQGQKKYAEAIAQYTKAIVIEPETSLLYSNRADCNYFARQYDAALADYTKLTTNKKYPAFIADGHLGRAQCLAAQHRDKDALADFGRALIYRPDGKVKVSVYVERAALYARMGKKQMAVKDYDQAIAMMPNNKKLLELRGKVMLAMGEYEQATFDIGSNTKTGENAPFEMPTQKDLRAQIAHYDKLLKMFPNGVDSRYNRGLLFLTLDDIEHGLADLRDIAVSSKVANDTTDSAASFACAIMRSANRDGEAKNLVDEYLKKPRQVPISREADYFMRMQANGGVRLPADPKRRTRVLTWQGIAVSNKDKVQARRHLTEVRNIGETSMDEYVLAMSYLKRLGQN